MRFSRALLVALILTSLLPTAAQDDAKPYFSLSSGKTYGPGDKPAIQMWLYPWLSLLALAGMAAVLIAMAVTPALQQDFNASCVTLVLAVVAYAILRQRRRAKGS